MPVDVVAAESRAPAERTWRRIDRVVLAAYLVVAGVKLAVHPMWRDELQSWDLARTSTSIGDLLSRVRYEQHPPLWYLLLYGWSRMGGSPRMLQALAFVLVGLTAAFILRFAPWPRPLRWLLLLGYYPIFEWSTLARPYLLTFLLAIIGAELVRRQHRGPVLGMVLAALILTDDAYGTVLAVALLVAGLSRTPLRTLVATRARGRRWPAGLVLAAVAAAALSDRPPSDYGGPRLRLTADHIKTAIEAPAHALLPMPNATTTFWNTWDIDVLGIVLVGLIGIVATVVIARVLRRDRAACLLWVLGVLGTIGVQCLTDLPYARFIGTIVVAAVCAFWIHPGVGDAAQRPLITGLAVLLGFQVPGGAVALAGTAAHPFSQSEAAAAAVRSLPGTVISVGDTESAPVAAYSGRALEMVDGGQPSYVTWNQTRLCGGRACSNVQMLEEALDDAVVDHLSGPTYLLTDFQVPDGTEDLWPVHGWRGAVVNTEDYWLYVYVP